MIALLTGGPGLSYGSGYTLCWMELGESGYWKCCSCRIISWNSYPNCLTSFLIWRCFHIWYIWTYSCTASLTLMSYFYFSSLRVVTALLLLPWLIECLIRPGCSYYPQQRIKYEVLLLPTLATLNQFDDWNACHIREWLERNWNKKYTGLIR